MVLWAPEHTYYRHLGALQILQNEQEKYLFFGTIYLRTQTPNNMI